MKREVVDAVRLEDDGGENRLDVLVEDVGAILRGELDGREGLAVAAARTLEIDAVEDAKVLVREEGDSELREVEPDEGDILVAEDLGGEDLSAVVRARALVLRVELDNEDASAYRDGDVGECTLEGVDGRDANDAGSGTGGEELVQELLGDLGLDKVIVHLDRRVVLVDEVLFEPLYLWRHRSSCLARCEGGVVESSRACSSEWRI